MPKGPLYCRNQCGQQIWFDWEKEFDTLGYTPNSDKPNIPLEVGEDGKHLPKKHQCPNSDYAQKKNGGAKMGNVQIEAVLGNTMDIIARIEKLEIKYDEMAANFHKLVEHLIHNPLDDDGDSMRENPEPEPES